MFIAVKIFYVQNLLRFSQFNQGFLFSLTEIIVHCMVYLLNNKALIDKSTGQITDLTMSRTNVSHCMSICFPGRILAIITAQNKIHFSSFQILQFIFISLETAVIIVCYYFYYYDFFSEKWLTF